MNAASSQSAAQAPQLVPVGQQQIYAQAGPDDAMRSRMVLVLGIATAALALFATMGFVNQLVKVLGEVTTEITSLEAGLENANKSLEELDPKVAHVQKLADQTHSLRIGMEGMNSDMNTMSDSVDSVSGDMGQLSHSLTGLEGDLTAVDQTNQELSKDMQHILDSTRSQSIKVRKVRKDVQASALGLQELPAQLRVASERILFINRVVCIMGRSGVNNSIHTRIKLLVPLGSGTVEATLIPAGAWSC
jgi:archaellum component FlaC